MSVKFPTMIAFRLVGAGLCPFLVGINYRVLVKAAFTSILVNFPDTL